MACVLPEVIELKSVQVKQEQAGNLWDALIALQQALKLNPYSFSGLKNMGKALLLANKPDVAIVDMYMPGKDGVQTITNMRITHPDTSIIAMSGDTNSDVYLRAAANLGVRAGLKKPFSRQQVDDAIKKVTS